MSDPSDIERPDEAPPQVTYLTGISFCGSTLLAVVLNAHPEILSIGEMGPAVRFGGAEYECSCGRTVVDCDFFRAVANELDNRGVEFDPGDMRLRHNYDDKGLWARVANRTFGIPFVDGLRNAIRDRLPGLRDPLEECATRNREFIAAALRATGTRFFFDATKHAVRIPFLARTGVDLRVVHLVRDPRGYAHSARRHDDWDAEQSAREFVRGHEEIEYYLKQLPRDRWFRVNYEALCADPAYWFSELTMFMGAGPMTLPDDISRHEYHVIGNAMRNAPHPTIELDEKWRETLSPVDLDTVARIAGPLARRYGYDI